jgi:hypothetical protein
MYPKDLNDIVCFVERVNVLLLELLLLALVAALVRQS